MSNLKKDDIFRGQVEIIVRNVGDGIGFYFGKFHIWKNSKHKYFIKNNEGKYWSLGGWIPSFHSTSNREAYLYETLKEALTKAYELFDVKPYSPEKTTIKKEYDRFDLMEFE